MRLISDQRGTLRPGLGGAKAPITTPSAASGKPEPGSEPSFIELGILGKQAFLCLPQLKRKMENSGLEKSRSEDQRRRCTGPTRGQGKGIKYPEEESLGTDFTAIFK